MKNIEDKFEDIECKFRNFIEDKFFNLIYNYGDGISSDYIFYDIRENIEISIFHSNVVKDNVKENIIENILNNII